MKTIGLTGGIACGKSSVAAILYQSGIKVISADELAHQAIAPNQPAYFEVLQEFGERILSSDGQIDRKKLGELVFQDSQARRKLEQITHPPVISKIKHEQNQSAEKGLDLLVVEVPLLFEVGLVDLFDEIWVVSSSVKEQYARLMIRDRLTEEAARQRINTQLPLKYKEEKADAVIYNNEGLIELKEKVIQLLKNME